MSEFRTQYSDGTGEVLIDYKGTQGSYDVPVVSDCNCGADREVTVKASPIGGEGAPVNIKIRQEGARETFEPSDQSTGMEGSDSQLFLGIKQKYDGALPGPCIM